MKRTIEVTAEDIEQGVRGSSDACPIALALGRMLGPEGRRLSVGSDEVGFMGRDPVFPRWEYALLPLSAAEFIASFDDGCDVSPFSFDLDVPEEITTDGDDATAAGAG